MRFPKACFAFICGALLASCAAEPVTLQYKQTTFSHLTGWELDQHDMALESFLRSCTKPKKTASKLSHLVNSKVLLQACEKARTLPPADRVAAKQFFETHFYPYALRLSSGEETGLLTGYFIPIIRGSREPSMRYSVPAYALPKDKILRGLTRERIAEGALKSKGLELLYIDSSVDLFFTQVQGSGRVQLDTGEVVTLKFAGKNGLPYTAIGKTLIEMGVLEKEEVNLESIRGWLEANPNQAQAVMNNNASYIFFALSESPDMPSGAQGVPLTAERSLAIDPSQMPYGLPVYIETDVKRQGAMRQFNQLLVSQDTGGAIKGPMRGDIFFGQGAQAGDVAGEQKFPGKWFVLIPKGMGS